MKGLGVEKKPEKIKTRSPQKGAQARTHTAHEIDLGSQFQPPEKFASLAAKLSHPANETPRAEVLTQLQQQYGNAFVQRVMSQRSAIQVRVREDTRLNGPVPYGGQLSIQNAAVRAAIRQAWADSDAASAANRHEEGGYVCRDAAGHLRVERWPGGGGANIPVPARAADGTYNGMEVVGEFHTHPNPPRDEAGTEWMQGPDAGEVAAIGAEGYSGNSYVISNNRIYMIRPAGTLAVIGTREGLLGR